MEEQRASGDRVVAGRRFDPMSTAWSVIIADVAVVLLVTWGSFEVSMALADGWLRLVLNLVIGGGVLMVFVAVPLRYLLSAQRHDAELREAALVRESGRREFNVTLTKALDLAQDDGAALEVAGRALGSLTPGAHAEILLADSSQAHLLKVVESPDSTQLLAGCSVTTPHACPAVRMGHALEFADSQLLDACPHLVGRSAQSCGAVCVPVGVMGAMVGVVHVVHPAGQGFDDMVAEGLESVAHQLGSRLGVLNAISQSQIQANTDPLTGLLNRRSLEQQARPLMREAPIFAVAFADLDHFKQLNDTHGHDMGDRALRLFARTLSRSLPSDALVARYGGEEFVVVLPNLNASQAAQSIDRVRAALEAALADGRVPAFTVSAGVVDNTEINAANLHDLIDTADGWLLQAKGAGRNRVLGGQLGDNVIEMVYKTHD